MRPVVSRLQLMQLILLADIIAATRLPSIRTHANLRSAPPVLTISSQASPGTTALSSPPGFEECYETLRSYRQNTTRPLVSLRQLEKHAPEVAERLSERVNFNVPSTVPGAIATFFAHPTAQFISVALTLSLSIRASLGPPTPADALAAAATALFWIVQEWFIHDKLLHSERPWFGETVHRWHHELPYYHVSLDGIGLAAVWFSTVAVLLVGAGLLTSSLPACLSSLAAYTFCGGLYEAAHYIAHTRMRPKTKLEPSTADSAAADPVFAPLR